MKERNAALWASPDRLTPEEAQLLIDFINKWGTRTPLKAGQLVKAYRVVFPKLCSLRGKRFEDVDLASPVEDGTSVADAVAAVFDGVAGCGQRYESTGASKIIHTWQPDLFVMWDMSIAGGYGLCKDANEPRPNGQEFARIFLPRLKEEAAEAIATYQGDHKCDAATAVCNMLTLASVATFPKLLDEYNYTKYRLGVEELWETLP